MRLWTLHPKYLDPQGLVAAWREALLAKAVLLGRTRGYRSHPQLTRFHAARRPLAALNSYLLAIHEEARRRGYTFDARKLGRARDPRLLPATTGQVDHEWRHLRAKLRRRHPGWLARWRNVTVPDTHPSFRLRAGPIAPWERT
jgi:hypothetical protein